ncbi:Ig-like domain-containing protein [Peribacillus glennii]|uniref:Bacterial Ig domain-containing protein n=1 Tax=Peribacillus glennii TaxID=2303991 RepID=A0A372L7T0_9BACI|nr:Ig-like domain-containing protein [Peribacillus glennii]RFU60771.1 hypothetical protein D0466_20690 [Peribacillus glennii]
MKKIARLAMAIMFIISFGLSPQMSYAALWEEPKVSTEDESIKVTVDETGLTKGPVTVTIDSSTYKNGTNVSYSWDLEKQITGSTARFAITKNGEYQFAVSDITSDYDYTGDTLWAEKWCTVVITNIDNEKPTVKLGGTFMDQYGYRYIRYDTDDDKGIRRIKHPDGEYSDYTDYSADPGIGAAGNYQIIKNGKYTFVAEDYAGNKTTRTVIISDYKVVPLKVYKVTGKTKYVTGKTLPKAKVSADNTRIVLGTAKADSKGNFKMKLKSAQKTGSVFYVSSLDVNKKSVTNTVKVKVVK